MTIDKAFKPEMQHGLQSNDSSLRTRTMSDNVAKNATPRTELEKQIMDPNIPKNEREWWAADEIERLRAQVIEAEKYNGWHQQALLEIERLTHEVAQMTTARTIMEAEIERLESDKERLRAVLQGLIEGPCAPRYRAEAEQLRTENERLRGEIICDYPNCDCHLPCLATGKTVGELCNRKHPEMRRVDHG